MGKCARSHTGARTGAHRCTHTRVHTHGCTLRRVHTHRCTHGYTRTRVHTHTHTRVPEKPRGRLADRDVSVHCPACAARTQLLRPAAARVPNLPPATAPAPRNVPPVPLAVVLTTPTSPGRGGGAGRPPAGAGSRGPGSSSLLLGSRAQECGFACTGGGSRGWSSGAGGSSQATTAAGRWPPSPTLRAAGFAAAHPRSGVCSDPGWAVPRVPGSSR